MLKKIVKMLLLWVDKKSAYVIYEWSPRKSLLVPFAQIVMIAAAFFVAVSRVMDYKHHPTDVIAGGLIGTIVQILNCFGATLIFSEEDEPLASRSEESIALRERNENESPKQS